MQYASINGLRRTAEPKLKAICEHCGSEVHAKCGSKIAWHWAHISIENCDTWYEPETQWHRDWKNHFGKDNSEISIVKDGIRHIADVLTSDKLVIEFQNSSISSETIVAREDFYDKMIWVINGSKFKDSFEIFDKDFIENWQLKIELKQDTKLVKTSRNARVLFINGNQIQQDGIREILIRNKFIYNKSDDVYFYDLNKLHTSHVLEAKIQGGILELYREQKIEKTSKRVIYTWSKPRISWMNSKKPVFIDFGEDYLVWIKTNIGVNKGEGLKILKDDFLLKYSKVL